MRILASYVVGTCVLFAVPAVANETVSYASYGGAYQEGVRKAILDHLPKDHGMDVKARFKEADDRIKKATSLNQALATVAWAVEGLYDSHTFFIPPPRPFHPARNRRSRGYESRAPPPVRPRP